MKRILLAIIIALALPHFVHADSFSYNKMNPTVTVVSYKKLYTGHIISFGSGSGTVINKDGTLLTNHHVIFDEHEQKPFDTFGICITFDVKEEPDCAFTARLIADNKEMDIAILKINNENVFNRNIPDLKYLNYTSSSSVQEKSEVEVIGYPGSGGETITLTKGQISGYDLFNGFKYFKTDTDFDHGSSGGTVLDNKGNFIGIPTYIRSYAENVGYFLDLREAKSWITENIKKIPIHNEVAELKLEKELQRFENANNSLKFEFESYPKLAIELPKDWHFGQITDTNIYVEQKSKSNPASLSIYLNPYQFEISDDYLEELDEELSKLKKQYPDYQKTETTFAGMYAWEIKYSYFNRVQYGYYIPYGYNLIAVNYGINLDKEDEQRKAIKTVIDSIEIKAEKENTPILDQSISFDKPAFQVTMPEGWKIQENKNNQPLDLLAEAAQKDNYKGYLYFKYRLVSKDEQALPQDERLKEKTKELGGKIIYKKSDVVLDGLKGILYTYEYEGSKYQEIHKRMTLQLKDGEHELIIIYDDLTDTFDENINDIKFVLNSFEYLGEENEEKGQYDYGSLTYNFSDVQYHRFSRAISDLTDKTIMNGYADGTFKPEENLTRAEALKIIFTSHNYIEKEKGLGGEIDFRKFRMKKLDDFEDVNYRDWFNGYIVYAIENDMIIGYSDSTFKPTKSINLAEAIKMITEVYEIPVWQGKTKEWYKKYMNKGYELGLIPRGMEDASITLTRAEFAELINRIYRQAE